MQNVTVRHTPTAVYVALVAAPVRPAFRPYVYGQSNPALRPKVGCEICGYEGPGPEDHICV